MSAEGTRTSIATKAVIGGVAATGCLSSPVVLLLLAIIVVIFGGAGVLLAPILALKKAFDPDSFKPEKVSESVQGNGTGELNKDAVPSDFLEAIKKAGGLCSEITPVVIAAQLDYASGFDANKKSPDGVEGIAQLPPDKFKQFGKDDDGNNKTSPLDATDSIMALGRYDCSLVGEVKKFANGRNVLSLALAAYASSVEEVRVAGGIPKTNKAQGYVAAIRALFPKFDGTLPAQSTTNKPTSTAPTSSATTPPPANAFLVSESQFNEMFPSRNPFYTYAGLTKAAADFPAFTNTGSDTVRKQEAAAFLANVNQESGGLVFVTEIDKSGTYCDAAKPFGCPAGEKSYYGRGPLQLTWNYNYNAAGEALDLELLEKPDQVEQDPAVAWKTALWFWMTQQGAGTMTAHDAMVKGAGFAETIRTINGARECPPNGTNTAAMQNRAKYYNSFAQLLDVPPGDHLTC